MSNENKKQLIQRSRWLPFQFKKNFEFPFNDAIDQLFNQFFNSFVPAKTDSFTQQFGAYPKCDIKNFEEKFQIEMQIPGMSKQDIKIQYDEKQQLLIISGEKRSNEQTKNFDYIKKELKKSKFVRSFYISKNDITGDFKASFQNGILIIDIAKAHKDKEEIQNTCKEIPIT